MNGKFKKINFYSTVNEFKRIGAEAIKDQTFEDNITSSTFN